MCLCHIGHWNFCLFVLPLGNNCFFSFGIPISECFKNYFEEEFSLSWGLVKHVFRLLINEDFKQDKNNEPIENESDMLFSLILSLFKSRNSVPFWQCWCLWSPNQLGLQFCTLPVVITPCFPFVWLTWCQRKTSKWGFMAPKYVEWCLNAILHHCKLKKIACLVILYSLDFKFYFSFSKKAPLFLSLLHVLLFVFLSTRRDSIIHEI